MRMEKYQRIYEPLDESEIEDFLHSQ